MFNIEIKPIDSKKETNSGFFQQTPFWNEFKSKHGWKKLDFECIADDSRATAFTGEFTVLTRSFGKGLFNLAYVPLFPSWSSPNTENAIDFTNFLNDLGLKLKNFLPKNTICIRFDPEVTLFSPEERDEMVQGIRYVAFADKLKIKKNKVDIQPPDSTQIDLTKTEEEILSGMKTKWRYNINLSARKGVEILKITGEDKDLSKYLDIFYDLYKITSARDGIAIHAKSYYEDLLKLSSDKLQKNENVPEISLYLAKHEEDYLGAIITLFSKNESIYLYGCSSNVKRNLMPNFLLQWTAMKDAKAYGSAYYDMYGMPPTDDENHPMHGLYLFKTGFGGKNIHRIGSWDVELKFIYRLITKAENLRAFWHKKILKKIRGR